MELGQRDEDGGQRIAVWEWWRRHPRQPHRHRRSNRHQRIGDDVLDGAAGNGTSVRLRRLLLRRLSRSMQIESLWRFNAKYDPKWIARYVVYGAAPELLPIAVAIIRAESLWDLPVVGRLFSPSKRRRIRTAGLRDAA